MDFDEIPDSADYSATPSSYLPEPETDDALSTFNREWNVKLENKRLAELKNEEEVKASAASDLANWNQQREIRMKAKKDNNRESESVVLDTIKNETESGLNSWDRVTKLVDISAEVSADSGKADTGRMKKLFIQIKNEPLELSRAN